MIKLQFFILLIIIACGHNSFSMPQCFKKYVVCRNINFPKKYYYGEKDNKMNCKLTDACKRKFKKVK